MNLECRCGAKKDNVPSSNSIGVIRQATGWVWLATDDSSIWLCKICGIRAKELAQELSDMGILRAHLRRLLYEEPLEEDGQAEEEDGQAEFRPKTPAEIAMKRFKEKKDLLKRFH